MQPSSWHIALIWTAYVAGSIGVAAIVAAYLWGLHVARTKKKAWYSKAFFWLGRGYFYPNGKKAVRLKWSWYSLKWSAIGYRNGKPFGRLLYEEYNYRSDIKVAVEIYFHTLDCDTCGKDCGVAPYVTDPSSALHPESGA